MTRTIFVLALGAALLASTAHADSIKGQENAEIAYCMIETNTTSGRTNKIARDRHNACMRAHGWLPNSGTPDILPPAYIESSNAAFAKADAVAERIIRALEWCNAISNDGALWRTYLACRTASGL
jgi:hypothetical protein